MRWNYLYIPKLPTVQPLSCEILYWGSLNTLRLGQNGIHFADNFFKCIFLNENVWISLKISLKFVPEVQINNIPTLVEIMAWHHPGDKPLSEPMIVSLLMHLCVTLPQWVRYRMSWIYLCQFIRPHNRGILGPASTYRCNLVSMYIKMQLFKQNNHLSILSLSWGLLYR